MYVNDALREIVNKSGNSLRGVAVSLGKHPNQFINATKLQHITFDTVADVAGACGYSVLLVDQATGESIALEKNPS